MKIKWTPDEKQIISASSDESICVWNFYAWLFISIKGVVNWSGGSVLREVHSIGPHEEQWHSLLFNLITHKWALFQLIVHTPVEAVHFKNGVDLLNTLDWVGVFVDAHIAVSTSQLPFFHLFAEFHRPKLFLDLFALSLVSHHRYLLYFSCCLIKFSYS